MSICETIWQTEDASSSKATIETAAAECNLGLRWWLMVEDIEGMNGVAVFLSRHDLEALRRAIDVELDATSEAARS